MQSSTAFAMMRNHAHKIMFPFRHGQYLRQLAGSLLGLALGFSGELLRLALGLSGEFSGLALGFGALDADGVLGLFGHLF